jgi:hypothetical protein
MDLLEYQQGMKEDLRQVHQQNYVGGIRQVEMVEPSLARKNLLPPPYIGFICLDGYHGRGDDYIGLAASHDFGIHSMRITILDDEGYVIESGEMSPFPEDPHAWENLPQVCVPPGTTVTIQIVAMDCMGGVGMRRDSKRMGEEEW